jgi:hypothetical protein
LPGLEVFMESDRFDALARVFSSRRIAVFGLVGGVAALLGISAVEDAGAHNPGPACRKIPDPVKRRKCLARARRHKRKAHSCKPQPVAVTCANRCGSVRNSCRKAVPCTCPAGKTCLLNGSCNRICVVGGTILQCPAGCDCDVADIEGNVHCMPESIAECEQVPMVCSSTAQCPLGHFCSTPSCGFGGLESRCVPVCPI